MSDHHSPLVMMDCLITAGAALAMTILISRLASDAGAPMIWFLTFVLAGGGAVQLVLAATLGQLRGVLLMLPYAAGAGVLLAGPMTLGYLAVAHVGAGYIALTFAFPILLTWGLARLLGLERADPRRMLAVVR
nr:hypothetical protein [Paracoccus saliphilus]